MKSCLALAASIALSLPTAARADDLSAAAAADALAGGALAWDLRAHAESGLPDARQTEQGLVDAWLSRRDLAALQAAVSRAGLDLSRDVVVYGEPGDARAQALVASLRTVSPGRVHWLVGGAVEWQASGRALASLGSHLPVPQHLVNFDAQAGHARQMAAASLRAVAPAQVLALR